MSVAESVCDRPALARATSVQPASGRAGTDGGAGHDGRLPLLLGGLIGLGPLSIDLYLPALPSIAHDLRAGDAAVALTLTGMLVGLAVGQLLVGPWSDVVGRRAPLIIGGAVHVAASLGCALAPSVALLDLARAVQGLGASAGAVLGMAVVRDLFQGSASARMLSRMVLVMSASPILAPSLGTALLGVLGWRSLFVTLAVLGVLITGATVWALPETLPVHHRVSARIGATVRVHNVAAAPFVLQRQFGLSQQQFGLLFALSVAALIGMLGNTVLAMSVVCAGGLVAATVLLLAMTQPQRH